MAVIGGKNSLAQIPGFDRIHKVASSWDEPISLHGSSVRRLAIILMNGESIDHTLPARCAPPPSDIDLQFRTKDPSRISKICEDIRDSAPIFQALRIESSSESRPGNGSERLSKLLYCPILSISFPVLEDAGFLDPTDHGLTELRDGGMSFSFQESALDQPDSLKPDERFHLYASALVFIKAISETPNSQSHDMSHAERTAYGFLSRNRSFVSELIKIEKNQPINYYFKRLIGIGYSLQATLGQLELEKRFSVLLPEALVDRLIRPPDQPLFRIGLTELTASSSRWEIPQTEALRSTFELDSSLAFAQSPWLTLPEQWFNKGVALDLIIPFVGAIENTKLDYSSGFAAAIEAEIRFGSQSETTWLSAFCEASCKEYIDCPDVLYVRIALDDLKAIQNELQQLSIKVEKVRVYLINRSGGNG